MSDDLIDRLHNPSFMDMEFPRELFTQCADRIQQLEAALREIACDGEDCHCQAPQYCSYGIARAALGEKKDD